MTQKIDDLLTNEWQGVIWIEKLQVWEVTKRVGGKVKHLGTFKTKKEAVQVREYANI